MAQPTPAPLLNLDTIGRPATVIIDGTPYVIVHPDGLSLMATRQLRPLIVRIEDLRAKELLTTAESEEEPALLNGICRIVLQAPDGVQKKLNDMQRMAVYLSFLELPSSMLQLLAARTKRTGATMTMPPSNGATTSHGSRGSTRGAARSSGSRRSQ